MRVSESDRFWSKVSVIDECWMWLGARNSRGYGHFFVRGSKPRKNVLAHRWAYIMAGGVIPPGMQIDHLCRVRACVNPAHMEVVTPRQNTLRGIGPTAENARLSRCRRGHALSGDNVKVGRGRRACRTCDRLTAALRRASATGGEGQHAE